ncbi:MAG TPA: hypothetical protein VL053_09960 [Arachidicoccus sp.]|nr:hypothetical protein [Arachidicoccus sp.]
MLENKTAQQELKKINSRIEWFCLNKINAFSPTISPAPKSVERDEIESIYEGVRYYVSRGVRDLVFQRKYMGSYCDIYLNQNLGSSYFVSRNGHRIDHLDLKEAFAACQQLHQGLDWSTAEWYIIQSEMLPWHALGGGLIENQFKGYYDAHNQHLSYLETSGLYGKIAQVTETESFQNFQNDQEKLSDRDFKKKYPPHIIRQYEALQAFPIHDRKLYRQGLDIYETQIGHYGSPAPLAFKPFNILKIIHQNGTESIVNDNHSYAMVNKDEFKALHFENLEAVGNQIHEIELWFRSLSAAMEEGIVIKPKTAFLPGLPPALKVRNNNYLTMIYGVHFLAQFDQQMRNRKIKKKLECSISDWQLNQQLLAIPYSELNKENYYLKNLVYDRIMGEFAAAQLDQRL